VLVAKLYTGQQLTDPLIFLLIKMNKPQLRRFTYSGLLIKRDNMCWGIMRGKSGKVSPEN
jgi:hypothetical protein